MIKVYGASDDLVEIEGDIREEFYYDEEKGSVLAFSDGTVLRVNYSPQGVWRISPVRGRAQVTQAPEDDEDNYSDVAIIHRPDANQPIQWCVFGSEVAFAQ